MTPAGCARGGAATLSPGVLHRIAPSRPPLALRGSGVYLHLEGGHKIIDASSGAAVACLGHGNRRVSAAIADQAGKLAYAHTGFFTSEPAEALADLLVGGEPGDSVTLSSCHPAPKPWSPR